MTIVSGKVTTSGVAATLLRVLEELPTIVWTTDPELRFTSAAGGARLPVRDGRGDVIGMRLDAFLGDSESDRVVIAAHRAALEGESTTFDWHGSGAAYRGRVASLRGEQEEIAGVAGVVFDMSFQEALYRGVFDSSLVPLALFEQEWRIVEANDALCELLGREHAAVADRPLSDFVPDDAVDGLNALLATKLAEEGRLDDETDFRSADGSRGRLALSAVRDVAPGRHLTVLLDITEQYRLEIQLRQAQTMEAIGRLAGGVAHDFNDVLMAVAGHASLLQLRFADDEAVSDDLGKILGAVESGAGLARRLMAISKAGDVPPAVADLNAVVHGIESMVHSLMPDGVEIAMRLDPGVAPVAAEPTQLEQVALNLVLNGRDAMPSGGRLEIETATVVDEPPLLDLSAGSYVRLTVADTGVGMDDQTIQHTFEPFFTTKHDGTDFGLTTVYSIVNSCGGAVRVTSAPGEGAAFDVFLPVAGS